MRLNCTISKLNPKKRIITAIASKVTDATGKPIVDSQGDIIPFDELEKATARFMQTGGVDRGGQMHQSVGAADIIGMIALDNKEQEALGFVPQGGMLIVKFYVKDDEAWDKVLSGEFSELSIGGKSSHTDLRE